MKGELDGELLEGGMPDRLLLRVTAQRDGLHIIGGDDPGHTAELDKAGNQAAQQGFLAHVGAELDKHPAAIFEAGGKEVARLTDEVGVGEGELADLTPVDLEQFAGQALEPDRNGGWERRPSSTQGPDVIVEGGGAAEVGMVRVLAGEFKHALDREFLLEPGTDLVGEDGDGALALAVRRLLVDGFPQHARNGVAVMAEQFRNLDVGPAFLL